MQLRQINKIHIDILYGVTETRGKEFSGLRRQLAVLCEKAGERSALICRMATTMGRAEEDMYVDQKW